ncbi:MAG: hypothetical protein AAF253_02530 [Pseudomonadota bacterium]
MRGMISWALFALIGLVLAACGAVDENTATQPYEPPFEADCFADGTLSDFPWPPPQYSAGQTVPRALLFGDIDPAGASLEDVAMRLERGLDAAGYAQRAFYGIGCDGFAVVTRLEQIDAAGTPVEGAERFEPTDASGPFSLTSYVAQLFYAPPGFYRQITFVVTPRRIEGDGSRTSEAELDALLDAGASTLPNTFGESPFTPRHDVTALIYEFRADGNRDAEAIIPARLQGDTHLEASGISAGLTTASPG